MNCLIPETVMNGSHWFHWWWRQCLWSRWTLRSHVIDDIILADYVILNEHWWDSSSTSHRNHPERKMISVTVSSLCITLWSELVALNETPTSSSSVAAAHTSGEVVTSVGGSLDGHPLESGATEARCAFETLWLSCSSCSTCAAGEHRVSGCRRLRR